MLEASKPFPPATVPESKAPGLTWPLLIAALSIAGIVLMVGLSAPWQKTAGDRIDYASRLQREFDASGSSASVWTEGDSQSTLRIEAPLGDVSIVGIHAMRSDTETRRTLKRFGFRVVIVGFDNGDPVTVPLD